MVKCYRYLTRHHNFFEFYSFINPKKQAISFKKYIPENAFNTLETLLERYKINLKIVNERQTKHGDLENSLMENFKSLLTTT